MKEDIMRPLRIVMKRLTITFVDKSKRDTIMMEVLYDLQILAVTAR
jgi:hypothetical protein